MPPPIGTRFYSYWQFSAELFLECVDDRDGSSSRPQFIDQSPIFVSLRESTLTAQAVIRNRYVADRPRNKCVSAELPVVVRSLTGREPTLF